MRGGRLRLRSAATSRSGQRCWWTSKDVIGELEPQSGAIGYGHESFRIDAHGLGEHEVAPLRCPAGRVVRIFEVRPAADSGGELEVGEEADAVRPGVWREEMPARGHALGELPFAEEPDGEHGVGLVDVQGIRRLEGFELRSRSRHLPAADPDAEVAPERRVALDVLPGQRLFEPE